MPKHAKPAKEFLQELPLHLVICRPHIHKAEVQRFFGMSVLVDDMLQRKGLMSLDPRRAEEEERVVGSACEVLSEFILHCDRAR